MGNDTRRFLTAALCGASGLIAAVCVTATASADPGVPPPPPAVPPVAGPLVPAPPAGPAPAAPLQAAAGQQAPAEALPAPAPAEGVPHIPSPDALPPGSTMDPAAKGNDDPNVSYLKDLWQAVQNKEISGKEALIMGLAQRGMNTPYPQQAAGPNVPRSGVDPAAPAGLPAAAGAPAPAAVPGAPAPLVPPPPAPAPAPAAAPVPAPAPAPGPLLLPAPGA